MAEKKQTIDYFKVIHPLFVLAMAAIGFYVLRYLPELFGFLFSTMLFPFFISNPQNVEHLSSVMGVIYVLTPCLGLAYFAMIATQLVSHIRYKSEQTLIPVWLMLSTALIYIASLLDLLRFRLGLSFGAFVISWIFYVLYLKCRRLEFIEKYRSNPKFRYLLWAGMIFSIVISFS